jgi:uncharacterized membrane protein
MKWRFGSQSRRKERIMRKLAVFVITVTLFASPHRILAEDYPQPVQVVATALGLSDQQIASLTQMLSAREQALQPLRQQLQAHQQAIGTMLQTPTPDAQALGNLLIETRAIEQQIAGIVSQAAAQFEQVLTSDQRDRLQQIRGAAQVCPAVPAFEATGLL